MIAFLKGRLVEKEPTHVIMDVNGVGYLVKTSLQTYSMLNTENATLHTLLIIREDAHLLYGFATKLEREMFEHLISVSGIGPSIALVFLSSMSVDEIRHAIVSEDLKTIQGIKGIGAKTAQRAIIELKDKLKKDALIDGTLPTAATSNANLTHIEALQALVTLGIPKATAEKSINTVLKKYNHEISLEELIKLSLR